MKKLFSFFGALVFGCFALVSCEQEAQPQVEQEPLTLQDIKVDPALEEAVAKEMKAVAEAQKTRDEINARTKEREENVKNLEKLLGK